MSTATDALMVQLGRLVKSPTISSTAISGFQATQNSTTKGVDVAFRITDTIGISAITLLRNFAMDPATASVMQTWTPDTKKYVWSDTDQTLQQYQQAFYWLVFSPQGTSGQTVQAGPQVVALNQQTAPPSDPSAISASHGDPSDGKIVVTVNVAFSSPSVKIYINPYHGNAVWLAVAQQSSAPIQFSLDVTGETTTIKAVGVSLGGVESAGNVTTTLALDATATIPATIEGATASNIAPGNQLVFPASKDAGPNYKIYRANAGDPFLSAMLIATVTSSAGTVNYLDTAGLSTHGYYIICTNGVGDSLPQEQILP